MQELDQNTLQNILISRHMHGTPSDVEKQLAADNGWSLEGLVAEVTGSVERFYLDNCPSQYGNIDNVRSLHLEPGNALILASSYINTLQLQVQALEAQVQKFKDLSGDNVSEKGHAFYQARLQAYDNALMESRARHNDTRAQLQVATARADQAHRDLFKVITEKQKTPEGPAT